MDSNAYLALGSNIGDRLQNLMEAIQMLKNYKGIRLVNSSSIYETAPVGYTDQADFLNMVIQVKTSLAATELLEVCLEVEQELGRKRELRWGPRIIDIDILLYNQDNIESKKLIVPHPRMHERAFVLVPLLEMNPSIMHPVLEQSLQTLLGNTEDREGVRLWMQQDGEGVFALFAN